MGLSFNFEHQLTPPTHSGRAYAKHEAATIVYLSNASSHCKIERKEPCDTSIEKDPLHGQDYGFQFAMIKPVKITVRCVLIVVIGRP